MKRKKIKDLENLIKELDPDGWYYYKKTGYVSDKWLIGKPLERKHSSIKEMIIYLNRVLHSHTLYSIALGVTGWPNLKKVREALLKIEED